MSKWALSIMTSLFLSIGANATEIEAVFHNPAGGGVDSSSSAMWAAMERTGKVKVKKIYYKSCAEAVNHIVNNPNSVMATVDGVVDFQGQTKVCPSFPDNNIKLVSIVFSASAYLCTSPSKTNLTMKDLLSDKVYKVANGMVSVKSSSSLIQQFLDATGSKSKVIPYANAVEFRAAVISGDVDYAIIINGVPELINAGSVCIASSADDNQRNLPSLRSFVKQPFPEFYGNTIMVSAHPNSKISEAIELASKDPEFIKAVSTRQGVYLGLGSEKSLQQQQDFIKSIHNATVAR
jgi:tripartite-type tricarboxylate transporter receptor subunit TctC